MRYELYYWPFIQGRGEFVRLAFEEAAADYIDVARLPDDQGGGAGALIKLMRSENLNAVPFAPPFVRIGELVLAHTANILSFIAPGLGLAPQDEAERAVLLQHQLTVTDFLSEIHDTHHPIASGLYYEDQKAEAQRRAENFLADRMPKFLGHFEKLLANNAASEGCYVRGPSLTYVDLSLFQVMSGLGYAFPAALAQRQPELPLLSALHKQVAERPRISAYLASERRLPFNQHGLFRHYPELDAE